MSCVLSKAPSPSSFLSYHGHLPLQDRAFHVQFHFEQAIHGNKQTMGLDVTRRVHGSYVSPLSGIKSNSICYCVLPRTSTHADFPSFLHDDDVVLTEHFQTWQITEILLHFYRSEQNEITFQLLLRDKGRT